MDDDEKQVLGRLVDPAELDAEPGARAVLRVEAPAAWLEEGGEVELAVPARLVCARCDGGGCDGCGRSGALAAPTGARRLVATLPAHGGAGVALRLVQPFGDSAAIVQLIVEIRPGPASVSLARVVPPRVVPSRAALIAFALLALAAAIGVGVALARP